MRTSQTAASLLIGVLLLLGGWRLAGYIAARHRAFQASEFTQAHPLLRWIGPDQPMTRGDWTLLAVQNVNMDFTYAYDDGGPRRVSWSSSGGRTPPEAELGLWLRLNSPIGTAGSPPTNSEAPGAGRWLSITGRTSTGETFPMRWQDASPGATVLTAIPGGYPDTVQWADVTVDDHHGPPVTWRVFHLPPMKHQIVPPVTAQNVFDRKGIHFALAAWHDHDPQGPIVRWRLRGRVVPAQHLWGVETKNDEQWEWGTGVPVVANSTVFSGVNQDGRCDVTGTFGPPGGRMAALPFLRDQHFVRAIATLHQRDLYAETVTFQDVPLRKNAAGTWCIAPPAPLTATTPSGITITLPDVSQVKVAGAPMRGTGIWYALNCSPHATAFLPKSAFWRKYRQPLDVFASLKLPPGYRDGGGEGDGHVNVSFFTGPVPRSKHLAIFSITVEQQVSLQTIPMTFTVPIRRPR